MRKTIIRDVFLDVWFSKWNKRLVKIRVCHYVFKMISDKRPPWLARINSTQKNNGLCVSNNVPIFFQGFNRHGLIGVDKLLHFTPPKVVQRFQIARYWRPRHRPKTRDNCLALFLVYSKKHAIYLKYNNHFKFGSIFF